jgi:Protein of unknown function (DUF2608)
MSLKVGVVFLSIFLSACAEGVKQTPTAVPTAPVESQVTTIKDLAEVAPVVAAGGKARTLLVLDIDDTLLTSRQFFGSDRWNEWQNALVAGDPRKVRCRFDLIALNFEAGTLVPTQKDGPEKINAIAVDKIFMTARSPLYRVGTIRELRRVGYALPAPLTAGADSLSYRWRKTAESKSVSVGYYDGVFMIKGQQKGPLLLDLMRRLNLSYERVVLVDDGKHNIEVMQAALKGSGISYHGLWYTRIDKTLAKGDEEAGAAGWQAWRSFLSALYPARLADLDAGRCLY